MIIQSILLNHHPAIAHGFGTRQEGGSRGTFSALNCCLNQGDDPEIVQENRHRLIQAVMKKSCPLITLKQVHGTRVIPITSAHLPNAPLEADGLVTNVRDILIGILTADCIPVLLFDPAKHIIGACHAGWRGAVGGIIPRTLEAMIALGSQTRHILAAIGPSIQGTSYEVDSAFVSQACSQDHKITDYLSPATDKDKYLFDLPGYVVTKIYESGVKAVEAININTYTNPDQFFSYRYTSHQSPGQPVVTGRQLSVIGLRKHHY